MNNILNAQQAFVALQKGQTVLCRYTGNGTLHGDKDFSTLDQVPASVFYQPHYEFCIKIETIELAGIKFTRPCTLEELEYGQEIFVSIFPSATIRKTFFDNSSDVACFVSCGVVQRDLENAELQTRAYHAFLGVNPTLNINGFSSPDGSRIQNQEIEKKQTKRRENKKATVDPQIEHNKDLIIDAIATCVTAEEVNTTCFGLEKNGFNQDQLDAIDKAKNEKLNQLALEKATAENAADELLNQHQVDSADPELSVLCDAFVDEINAATSAEEIKAIRNRINSNGDLTEVESAELATRINLKSALFEKDQSHVSFDNIAAAAVAQAQKVDVETQQKNESGHYFDQVKKETAAWNEQLQKLLKDLETTNNADEANSLVSQTMSWTKEQREPLLRAISRRLQHFQNPQATENPSISVQIQNATDLTTLDSLEIDVSTLDPIIQPDMMRLITTRRLQLENAANDGGHAS
ncbi:hypothetical protein AAV96_08930 [Acinetobacter sp. AG1]|uniref:hypothetical protein n=1 Tax=Acinetobacter sp. AG1 TaxID=348388 RepID=UPI000629C502|nr:hypothetical protein [Acinetobacter sp. AG1]KKW79016.1 hypothetical protein AAV96_08930 [Acinetobacter sp. AG1]